MVGGSTLDAYVHILPDSVRCVYSFVITVSESQSCVSFEGAVKYVGMLGRL